MVHRGALIWAATAIGLSASLGRAIFHERCPRECCGNLDCAPVEFAEELAEGYQRLTTKVGTTVVPPAISAPPQSRQSCARVHGEVLAFGYLSPSVRVCSVDQHVGTYRAIEGQGKDCVQPLRTTAVHLARTALGVRRHAGAWMTQMSKPRALATLVGLHIVSCADPWPNLGFWLPIAPASAAPGWTEHSDRVRNGIMERVGPRRKAKCEE
jgi:hypothetical protein